jgi:hypothetical protein
VKRRGFNSSEYGTAAPYLPEKLIRALHSKGVQAIENVAVEEDK